MDGEPPLIELVHARINAAMRKRRKISIRGRWVGIEEAKARIAEEEALLEAQEAPP